MLYSIAGSQSTGKTTLLNELKKLNYKVIERKTSRSILSDWGVTLQQVNNDHDVTIKFQDEIIKRKFEDEQEAVNSKEIWFTERTYADLFTYAIISLGKDNLYSGWLNSYYKKCKELQQHYQLVFYLTAGHFNIEHDGVRGSNQYYSKMVDSVMLDFTKQLTTDTTLSIVDTASLEHRVEDILWYIEHIK